MSDELAVLNEEQSEEHANSENSSNGDANQSAKHGITFRVEPEDVKRLANLCGQLDCHIKQIANHFKLKIYNRGARFQIEGDLGKADAVKNLINRLYRETHNGTEITPDLIHLLLREAKAEHSYNRKRSSPKHDEANVIKTPRMMIQARGDHQQGYLKTIRENVLNFGVGPAGTGKTYLAVACAVEALMRDEVSRILLVRPAVEAGEKLGFLPGDLSQKIDPYLRPLYDALNDMLGSEQVEKLIERNVIEVAPLAYMRGRTLSHCYVILDESQNTTREQMKMFLTRIGFGSKAVVTGDITQVDLPRGIQSGLRHVLDVLEGVEGIGLTRFANSDVVRHPMVQKVVDAYDKFETAEKKRKDAKYAEEKRIALEQSAQLQATHAILTSGSLPEENK
ncbi:PhoH family protein [Oleispira antarctica RB-8]|uniref:PhoH-like protein n=1 Tax=Oleispira antarctica RB-8 TaxID=698738 RepID=R4YKM7_OLEAN|nr:PhoH family protein [Oleispira antarctica RB-8]